MDPISHVEILCLKIRSKIIQFIDQSKMVLFSDKWNFAILLILFNMAMDGLSVNKTSGYLDHPHHYDFQPSKKVEYRR